jgi:ABC-2 type transport system permease protein
LLLLYGFAALYLLAVLGFGLLISTYSDTQQQAMLVTFFFMLIFILLSGLYTPIESMPPWAKFIAQINPVTYLVDVMRMVILKGSTFRQILPHIGIISIFAVILNSWAILNYQKMT